jgi:raffinose/stachyose/melibiose transport system substrate-binding protein
MSEADISRRTVLKGGAAAAVVVAAAPLSKLGRGLERVVDRPLATLEPAAGSTVQVRLLVDNTLLDWWKNIVTTFNATSSYKVVPSYSVISNGNAKTQLPAALSSRDSPDLAYSLLGSYTQTLVQDNLLVDLTPYAKKYNWAAKYSPAEFASFYFGKLLAGVSYDAVPHTFIWYEPAVFAKLGLKVPASRIVTAAQMQHYANVAKKAGLQPLTIGNHDLWPGSQTMSMVVQRTLDDASLTKLKNAWTSDSGLKWTDPLPLKAVTRTQQIVKSGWFAPDINAIAYSDAVTAFFSKQAIMYQDGYWLQASFKTDAPHTDVDFFEFPAFEAGLPVRVINFGANGMVVSKNAKQPAAAAALINASVSLPAQKLFLTKYANYPGILGVDKAPGITYPTQALKNVVKLLDHTPSNPFQMENDSPGAIVQDMMVLTQSLLALQITPREFSTKLQAMIDSNIKSQRH